MELYKRRLTVPTVVDDWQRELGGCGLHNDKSLMIEEVVIPAVAIR